MLLLGVGMVLSPPLRHRCLFWLCQSRLVYECWARLMCDSEIQLFLIGYIVIQICEIFTVGGIPLDDAVRKVSIRRYSSRIILFS